jgi:hypothetical protein
MGRGLSDLQRYIPAEAGKRSRVYYADVLEGFHSKSPMPAPAFPLPLTASSEKPWVRVLIDSHLLILGLTASMSGGPCPACE